MTNEKLYEAIGNIKEEHILEAKQTQNRISSGWMKWCALAACLCLIVGAGFFFSKGGFLSGSGIWDNAGFWGDGNSTLLKAHRDDFSAEIEPDVLAQFKHPSKTIKVYSLLTNQWFLSEKLDDFSQVVNTDFYYITAGDRNGNEPDTAYSCFDLDANGQLELDYEAYPLLPVSTTPNGFWKLTYETIDAALSDIVYEDYIITYSSRLYTIFVWVRGTTEDWILTYPTRPEFVGLENGALYTLEELQKILTETYHND